MRLLATRAASVAVSTLLLLAACAGQAEGEFCDPDAGVTGGDCQGELACVQAPGLPSSVPNRYRCCPSDPSQATTDACRTGVGTIVAPEGGTVTTEGGSSEAAAPEGGGTDAIADSPADVLVSSDSASTTDGAASTAPEAGGDAASPDGSDGAHE
jgi:hypothetical protein